MKKNNGDFVERRQYLRITRHFILTYFNTAEPGVRYAASQLKNISKGGMCLVTETDFPKGGTLGVELKTPFLTSLTHLEGKVLGSNEKMVGLIYETRIKFENLSPEAEYVIAKIIEHFQKEGEG